VSELLEGLVISHLGQGIAVEYNDKIALCQTLRRLETVAVGKNQKRFIKIKNYLKTKKTLINL